jgi:hypothetical protein
MAELDWMLVTENHVQGEGPTWKPDEVTYSAHLWINDETKIQLWTALSEEAAMQRIEDFAKQNGLWDEKNDDFSNDAPGRIDLIAMT